MPTPNPYPRAGALPLTPTPEQVPYTKSVMSFFELYRMNVPLFAPSVELLVKWEMKHSVMVRCPYPYPYPYPHT